MKIRAFLTALVCGLALPVSLSESLQAETGLFMMRYQDKLGVCVYADPKGAFGPVWTSETTGALCGHATVAELLADAKFVWRIEMVDQGKYTLRTSAGGTDACLLARKDPLFNLQLKATTNGGLCGYPTREALLQDKSLLFGIEPLGTGPTVIKTLVEDGLTCLGKHDTVGLVTQRNWGPRNAFCGAASAAELAGLKVASFTFERIDVPPPPPPETGYPPPANNTWAALTKAYFAALPGSGQGLCTFSTVGSPVPLAAGDAIPTGLPDLDFSGYAPLSPPEGEQWVTINNGHAFEIVTDPDEYRFVLGEDNLFNRNPDFFKTNKLVPPLERTLRIGSVPYRLLQLHFHSPSEHLLEGGRYAMEAHLVHRSDQGHLAVVAVLVDLTASVPVSTWFNGFYGPRPSPGELGYRPTGVTNLPGLLPSAGKRSYVRYDGSLTTPPCSEAVSWFALTTPVPIYSGELAWFTGMFLVNARPLQSLNNRVVVKPQ